MSGAVDTTLQPPPFDLLDQDEDDEPTIHLHLSITEPDGTCRSATITLDATTGSDAVLADALLRCVRGAATMRGPGLVRAVERQLRQW